MSLTVAWLEAGAVMLVRSVSFTAVVSAGIAAFVDDTDTAIVAIVTAAALHPKPDKFINSCLIFSKSWGIVYAIG